MVATLQNVAHRSGILRQRRFDPVADVINAHYDLKLGYPSSHQFALDSVPGARVLDLGAGPGGFARELVRKGCTVTVVDRAFDDPAAIRTSPASARIWTTSRLGCADATFCCCST